MPPPRGRPFEYMVAPGAFRSIPVATLETPQVEDSVRLAPCEQNDSSTVHHTLYTPLRTLGSSPTGSSVSTDRSHLNDTSVVAALPTLRDWDVASPNVDSSMELPLSVNERLEPTCSTLKV